MKRDLCNLSDIMLVDIPLENRERSSPLKKLCTAVSREAPELFRINGVPCIDRGPDKSGPPVAYEHWNDSGGASGDNRVSMWQQEGEKKTANFARPSSVSADTPNFFKVWYLCAEMEAVKQPSTYLCVCVKDLHTNVP